MDNKRWSRWAASTTESPSSIVDVNGRPLPTAILTSMTAEQLDLYVTNLRIEEISSHLRLQDTALLAQAPFHHRQPSPDPEYDEVGRRTNTRIQRRRRALEVERHRLVEELTANIPNFRPPCDYSRPRRFSERVAIPQAYYPDVRFIGQILGPRGKTLRAIQERTGTVMAIRGKGSVKEGKGRQGTNIRHCDHTQPLHVLITGETQAKVDGGVKLIQQIIDNAISQPDWQNEHKRAQLRALAVANGTFRDDEARLHQRQICNLSSSPSSVTDGTNVGPLTRPSGGQRDAYLEQEYENLMSELRES